MLDFSLILMCSESKDDKNRKRHGKGSNKKNKKLIPYGGIFSFKQDFDSLLFYFSLGRLSMNNVMSPEKLFGYVGRGLLFSGNLIYYNRNGTVSGHIAGCSKTVHGNVKCDHQRLQCLIETEHTLQ